MLVPVPVNCKRAVDAGDWVREIGIEVAAGVMDFGKAREEVVTKPEVEGQFRSDLPVVLYVGRDGTEASSEYLLEVLGEADLSI